MLYLVFNKKSSENLVIFQVGVIDKRHVTYGTCEILLLLFGVVH